MLKNLNNEQAAKEFKLFSILGLACAIVALLVFWWLGIVGLAFSARALILARHPANNTESKKFLIFAAVGLVLSFTDVVLYYSA